MWLAVTLEAMATGTDRSVQTLAGIQFSRICGDGLDWFRRQRLVAHQVGSDCVQVILAQVLRTQMHHREHLAVSRTLRRDTSREKGLQIGSSPTHCSQTGRRDIRRSNAAEGSPGQRLGQVKLAKNAARRMTLRAVTKRIAQILATQPGRRLAG